MSGSNSTGTSRHANPYRAADSRWQPDPQGDPLFEAAPPLAGIMGVRLEELFVDLLAELYERVDSIPLTRRFFESFAIHTWRFDASAVISVMDTLTTSPHIYKTTLEDADMPFMPAVLGLRPPTAAELRILKDMIKMRESILSANVLGNAGERYVRHYFKHSRKFVEVSQARSLGRIRDSDESHALDLLATDLKGRSYAISVKNVRDVVGTRRTMKWVDEIASFASAHSTEKRPLLPWLIPSFAAPNAIAECTSRGVICTAIGARVAPEKYPIRMSTRTAIRDLYAVIGPEPFRYVGTKRVHNYDADFLKRIAAVADAPLATYAHGRASR